MMIEQLKPSGIDWIGDIPYKWDIKRIKYVINDIKDGTHGTYDRVESGEPLLSAKNVFDDGIHIGNNESEISYTDYSAIVSNGFPRKNDVLLCCVGTIGRCCVYEFDKPLAFQRSVSFLRPLSTTSSRFLKYALQSDSTLVQEQLLLNKSAQEGLYMGSVRELVIALPNSYDLQEAIADYLDSQCAKLDGVIADLEKQIDTLQKYKKSLITETVTKGLDKSVPMKDSGIEWIGKIPEQWKIIRITKYLDSLVDYRGKTPEKVDDGVFLVTARNIKNGIVDYSLSQEYVAVEDYEEIMHRGKPQKGDVLFTTEAPLGEVANVDNTDIALAQRVIKFRGRKNCINNYYLKYWLMSLGFQSFLASLATGSTALGIAASKLGQLKMVLPTYDEQNEIVMKLDSVCGNIDAIVVTKKEQLENIQKHKKSLIYEYVTGKKRVTEVK